MEKPRIVRLGITTVLWAFICFSFGFLMHHYLSTPGVLSMQFMSKTINMNKNTTFLFPLISVLCFIVFEVIHGMVIKHELKHIQTASETKAIYTHLFISAVEACFIVFFSVIGMCSIMRRNISILLLYIHIIFLLISAIAYVIGLIKENVMERGLYDVE